MTNKLVVVINSLKLPKIKKILLYEMKFIVANYSCLQNPLTRGLPPPDPRSLCPLSSTEFVDPPPNRIPGYATDVWPNRKHNTALWILRKWFCIWFAIMGRFMQFKSLTLCVALDGEFTSTAAGCIGLGAACTCLAEVLVSGVAQCWWGEVGQACCMSYGRWVCQGLLK